MVLYNGFQWYLPCRVWSACCLCTSSPELEVWIQRFRIPLYKGFRLLVLMVCYGSSLILVSLENKWNWLLLKKNNDERCICGVLEWVLIKISKSKRLMKKIKKKNLLKNILWLFLWNNFVFRVECISTYYIFEEFRRYPLMKDEGKNGGCTMASINVTRPTDNFPVKSRRTLFRFRFYWGNLAVFGFSLAGPQNEIKNIKFPV